MNSSEAGLILGSIEQDLVLASETGSLRRLLEACGLAFRLMPLNLDEVATHQALLKNMGETDPADVAEVLTRAKIEEAASGAGRQSDAGDSRRMEQANSISNASDYFRS